MVDAHSLWHASTIPITLVWWAFLAGDAVGLEGVYLDGRFPVGLAGVGGQEGGVGLGGRGVSGLRGGEGKWPGQKYGDGSGSSGGSTERLRGETPTITGGGVGGGGGVRGFTLADPTTPTMPTFQQLAANTYHGLTSPRPRSPGRSPGGGGERGSRLD